MPKPPGLPFLASWGLFRSTLRAAQSLCLLLPFVLLLLLSSELTIQNFTEKGKSRVIALPNPAVVF